MVGNACTTTRASFAAPATDPAADPAADPATETVAAIVLCIARVVMASTTS